MENLWIFFKPIRMYLNGTLQVNGKIDVTGFVCTYGYISHLITVKSTHRRFQCVYKLVHMCLPMLMTLLKYKFESLINTS